MLTGKELGAAINTAIDKKIASGAIRTKIEVAKHFEVKPPSLHDWIKRGTISKDKLFDLFDYFSDVVGPEHWGLQWKFLPNNKDKDVEERLRFCATQAEIELLRLYRQTDERGQADILDNAVAIQKSHPRANNVVAIGGKGSQKKRDA